MTAHYYFRSWWFILTHYIYGVRGIDRAEMVPLSGVPGIPRQGGQAAASIHFLDGGGGVKVRKIQKNSARFARKVAISNFSRKARGKN